MTSQTGQRVIRVGPVFPELSQARAHDSDGVEYALTSNTPGIDLNKLATGQKLDCLIDETGRVRQVIASTL